jgi:hypothetical protein
MTLDGAETSSKLVYVIIFAYNKCVVINFVLWLTWDSFVIKDYLVTWYPVVQMKEKKMKFQTQYQSNQKQDSYVTKPPPPRENQGMCKHWQRVL